MPAPDWEERYPPAPPWPFAPGDVVRFSDGGELARVMVVDWVTFDHSPDDHSPNLPPIDPQGYWMIHVDTIEGACVARPDSLIKVDDAASLAEADRLRLR